MNIIEDQTFENQDFAKNALEIAEYDSCVFDNCNIANASLSRITFVDCSFVNCDLSLVNLSDTALKTVSFRDCKMLGLHFDNCAPFLFETHFDDCMLNISSFYKVNLKKSSFTNCSLQQVDFSESNMEALVLQNCALDKAIFANTNIEKADFRTSSNYAIDLTRNKCKKAKFSKDGLAGLLHNFNIVID